MWRLFLIALTLTILSPLLVVVLVMTGVEASDAECGTGLFYTSSGPLGGVPSQLVPLYQGASTRYGLGARGPSILAAINYVETDFGQDLSTSSAGAVGWMQFMSSSWAQYGVTPDGSKAPFGPTGWNNPADAIYSAANLLHASGAPGNWPAAVFDYNHAVWYIQEVLSRAADYYTQGLTANGSSNAGTPQTGPTILQPVVAQQSTPAGSGLDQSSAMGYVHALVGVQVGFAVVTASGQVLAQDQGHMAVPSASVSKAMLLVAYLNGPGRSHVSGEADGHLAAMIEQSSNQDANWVLSQVGTGAVLAVARAAGMSDYRIDTSDPNYHLGESRISALDLARLFARIDQLMAAGERSYGMGLLEHLSPADQWGILSVGVGVAASKAGWKPEPGNGWVINQAGQLQSGGQTVGIAIVSEGESSQTAGEQIMQTVAGDLLSAAGLPVSRGTPAAGGECAMVSGPTVPGAVAQVQPDGTAAIPAAAPPQVQQAIAAGNRIIHTFYSQERRPGMLRQVQDSYDCSGSTDFILYNAGLSSPLVDVGNATAGDSTTLEQYGENGPGQWITVYGSANHAFIQVAGILLDTSYQGAAVTPSSVPDPYPPDDPVNGGPHSGPRWVPMSILQSQLHDGNSWSIRHPPGL